MNEIYPGYPTPFRTPLYWRDEVSGKLSEAIETYFEPYTLANLEGDRIIPALSDRHLQLIRQYLIYYVKAPCWRQNLHADSEHEDAVSEETSDSRAFGSEPRSARRWGDSPADVRFALLNKLVEQAQKVQSREDISQFTKDCMTLGLDPF